MNCLFCNKVPEMIKTHHPSVVQEFKHSLLIVGEHQMFPGYCVLVIKEHAVELFELNSSLQKELIDELSRASAAISQAYGADKINVASYGNMTPHLHWHIFPRHKTDLAWPNPPWKLMDQYKDYVTTAEAAKAVAQKIQKYLIS